MDAAKTAANGATAANDALSSLGTASMTVNAASVFINGSPVGAPGGIPGLDGAPVEKVTREALAPLKEAANDSKKLASSWGLTGNGAKNHSKMLAESWGLTGSGAGAAGGKGGSFAKNIDLSPRRSSTSRRRSRPSGSRAAGDMQGKGIIDTILNRKASGKWGNSITDVVNAQAAVLGHQRRS